MISAQYQFLFPQVSYKWIRSCLASPDPLTYHGRVVTSSRQITEVKQRRDRLALGWVTAHCSSHAPAMCRGVGQASHITMPLSTQQ